MERSGLLAGLVLTTLVLAGCGSSETPAGGSAEAQADVGKPADAVTEFLTAVRDGEEEKAANMLTEVARKKTQELDMAVAPPGSATATFAVGEVEMIGEEGAHVACQWTDADETGKPHTDEIIWMLRREPQGWRIAGMATRIFDNEMPLLLNFEDPEDMIRKQRMAEEEMARRSEMKLPPELQAKQVAPAPAPEATQTK